MVGSYTNGEADTGEINPFDALIDRATVGTTTFTSPEGIVGDRIVNTKTLRELLMETVTVLAGGVDKR